MNVLTRLWAYACRIGAVVSMVVLTASVTLARQDTARVPEIDGTTAPAALALLFFSVMILIGPRATPKPANEEE